MIARLRVGVDGFTLPTSIVGMRMPVLAEPGAGKSVFVAVLIEELWRAQLQFVAICPLGTGWGVKASADGEHAGLALPFLGAGRYADAPLRPDGGAVVARALVATGASMMLNVSGFGREEQNHFVADFWNELLRLAAERHDAGEALSILNLIDEAGFFMPETPRGKQQARVQDAGERIARQGRGLGLGFFAPTQRPQGLDKDVLGMWEILVLMRLTEPTAIARALSQVEHVLEPELVAEIRLSLPHLGAGEAWFISPRVLKLTRRVQIRMRETYDSTRTPVPGERRRAPRVLADVDLAGLRLAMALDEPTIETQAIVGGTKHTENDRRVTILERDVAAARDRVITLENENRDLHAQLDAIGQIVQSRPSNGAVIKTAVHLVAGLDVDDAPAQVAAPTIRTPRPSAPANGDETHPAARKLLAALAQHAPARFTWGQAATLAGLKPTGGHYNAGRKALRDAGYIEETGDLISASAAGLEAAGEVPPAPSTSAERLAMWCGRLPSPAPDMLRTLAAKGERYTETHDLAATLGKKATGGHWNSGIAVLRNNGLIEVDGRKLRAAVLLR